MTTERLNLMGAVNFSLEFTDEIVVKCVRATASDDMVVQAAQVSSKGQNNPGTVPPRLIRALMAGKHGSPFEHNSFTFFVEAPLFVFREWQRHRISSFNEMSGRYTQMIPKFYMTPEDRPMIMEEDGTKMRPKMLKAPEEVWRRHVARKMRTAEIAWESYQADLADGIVNEVAREDLPLSLYSQMYWTVNARSLMNFLSLRVESDDSLVRSYPQREIMWGAEQVEEAFRFCMPETHAAFVANGRVAP